jgi:Flp pilus assembly protein TadG
MTTSELLRDNQGAIYLEFLVAFMPLFTLFLCLCELANLYSSKLVVRHAAYRAARAGAVVFPDDPANYTGGHSKLDDVKSAGLLPLRAKGGLESGAVSVLTGDEYERGQPVTVRVTAMHRCVLPIASRLVCSTTSGTRALSGEVSLPAHAARYPYPEDSSQ